MYKIKQSLRIPLIPAILFTSFAANSMAMEDGATIGAPIVQITKGYFGRNNSVSRMSIESKAIYSKEVVENRLKELNLKSIPYGYKSLKEQQIDTDLLIGYTWRFKPTENKYLSITGLSDCVGITLHNEKTKSIGAMHFYVADLDMGNLDKFLNEPLDKGENAGDFKVHLASGYISPYLPAVLSKLKKYGYQTPSKVILQRVVEKRPRGAQNNPRFTKIKDIYYTDNPNFNLKSYFNIHSNGIAVNMITGEVISSLNLINKCKIYGFDYINAEKLIVG